MIGYSLFAGGGGLELGLEQAGINVAVSTDIDRYSESTHKRNWPRKPFFRGDIRKLTGAKLLDLADGVAPDIIFGGPPCQGFSTLGDKLSADPRNILFDQFARIVDELKPKMVLIENVKSLVTMYGGQYREYIIQTFSRMGFTIYESILDAAQYGVPQFRRRVFFFGSKLPNYFCFPSAMYGSEDGLKPYETVGNWILDLVDSGPEIPNHIALRHSEKVIARYRLISEGGSLPPPSELPKELRRTNFGNTYKRLDRNKPSSTLVPGNNAFPIHPILNRSLTPREAARLQAFPDSFIFEGDRRHQCILVGNAVPPPLAKAIGSFIITHSKSEISQELSIKPIVEGYGENTSFRRRVIPTIDDATKLSNGFIDLFAGAGGLTIGFARAGWKPLLCIDIDGNVANTHKHNFPDVPFMQFDLAVAGNISKITSQFPPGEIGIVAGGPPCQGFSVFGKRRFINTRGYDPHSDPRNKLVYAFLNVVRSLQPRWFLMENVAGIENFDSGLFLKSLVNEFISIGYTTIEARVINTADYGVPQLRRRMLLIGNRTGHILPWPKKKYFLNPKDWQNKYRTVGEVIADLADDNSYFRYTCHVPMKHKPLVVERFKYIREGEKLDISVLPEYLRTGYRTEHIANYSHVLRRLHRDEPSITIVPGHNALPIHPWLNRALTVREAARIQTFPDDIVFKGSRQNQCIQVGNAFPPTLAELMANNIRKAEVNEWFPGAVPPSAYYALLEKPEAESSDSSQMILKDIDVEPGADHSLSSVEL
ncbi:DNA cytosine methyltransferase [Chloroflexota bacterium]